MKQIKWVFDNKLISVIVGALITAMGFLGERGVTSVLDSQFQLGKNTAKNECLDEIKTIQNEHLADYRNYVRLQIKCPE